MPLGKELDAIANPLLNLFVAESQMLAVALGGTFLAAEATLQNLGRTNLPLVLATSAAE